MENRKNLDSSGLRTHLQATHGKEFWRSLDELAQLQLIHLRAKDKNWSNWFSFFNVFGFRKYLVLVLIYNIVFLDK